MSNSAAGFETTGSKSVAAREDEGHWIHVKDEVGEKMYVGEGDARRPVRARIAGTYSSTYRRAVDAQRERLYKTRKLDAEQAAENALNLIAACVLEWEGFLANGQPLPADRKIVVPILDEAPWIREQFEEAMQDHAAFFPKPSNG